jgi:acetamidase/formamidase
VAIHEIPLEQRTVHGHFSHGLEPILTIDSRDAISFATLDAGWAWAAGPRDGRTVATSATRF